MLFRMNQNQKVTVFGSRQSNCDPQCGVEYILRLEHKGSYIILNILCLYEYNNSSLSPIVFSL